MNDWREHRIRRIDIAHRGTLDTDNRTVRAVLATDDWVRDGFGPTKLTMTSSAIDMTRAAQGLPWHDTHGPGILGERIGITYPQTYPQDTWTEGEQNPLNLT